MSESDLNRFMSYNLFWSSSVQLSTPDETRTRNSATPRGRYFKRIAPCLEYLPLFPADRAAVSL